MRENTWALPWEGTIDNDMMPDLYEGTIDNDVMPDLYEDLEGWKSISSQEYIEGNFLFFFSFF